MTVKIAAGFGKDEPRRNRFVDIQHEILKNSAYSGMAVVWVDRKGYAHDDDKGEDVPTVRILAAEPLDGEHEEWARKVLDLRYRNRTGKVGFEFPEDDADFMRAGTGTHVSSAAEPDAVAGDWDPADDVDADSP